MISVIIPTYNRKSCIMTAVNSVLKQKNKHFDYEVIVSDDGSTDGTNLLFSKKHRKIMYFWHKNLGVNGARNLGIKKAKGNYFLFLDSDDYLKKDTFEIIAKHKHKLKEINFFGTLEEKKNKKMYFLEKTRNYSYKEWLEGKTIRGEFIPLIKASVFKKNMFEEKRFCFEGFFWNKVINKYGVMAFDEPIRLYSFAQDNRVSVQLHNPEKAKKRHLDYIEYLRRFEKDYKQYKLYAQLGKLFLTTGFYASLSGNKLEARKYFIKSIKTRTSIKNLCLYLLSFLGKKPFLIITRFIE